MPKRRWQFSLKTLLIVVTLIALMMALWATNNKLHEIGEEYRYYKSETKAEIEKYRAELGHLTISDPKRVHAAQVPTLDGTWRWRVYIPEGRKLKLRNRAGRVPRTGYPGGMAITMEPGEHTVWAGMQKNLEGRQVFTVKSSGAETAIIFSDKDIAWIKKYKELPRNSSGVLDGKTQSAEPGMPLLLLRSRVQKKTIDKAPDGTVIGSSTEPYPGPADGIMIWITDPDGKKVLDADKNTPKKP